MGTRCSEIAAVLVLVACVQDPVDTGESIDPARWLGACDIYDVLTLEEGLPVLEASDLDIDAMVELGLNVGRPHRFAGHVFATNVVYPLGSESWDWTLPDHVVREAGDDGVHLLVTLQPFTHVEDPQGQPFFHPEVSQEGMPLWLEFIGRVVERYDGDGVDDMPGLRVPVLAWEVGNEPSCGEDDVECQSAYAELVRVTWEEAHAAHPDAVVMAGGAAPVLTPEGDLSMRTWALYDHFFAEGGASYTDVFSFHTIVGEAEPDLSAYLDVWEPMVGGLPLWLTETGPYNPTGDIQVSDDPAESAAWLDSQLGDAWDLGIERAMWCRARRDWRDPPEVWEVVASYADVEAP